LNLVKPTVVFTKSRMQYVGQLHIEY